MDIVKRFLSNLQGLWYAPFAIFLIGFIYIQGAFSPFLSGALLFEQILTVAPVSYTLYITNGIMMSFFIIPPLILAHLLIKFTRISNGVIQFFRIGSYKHLLFFSLNISVLIVIVVFQFNIYLMITFDTRFIFFVIYFLYFLSAFFYYKFDREIYILDNLKRGTATLYYSCLLVLILIISIYLNGMSSQYQIVNNYKSGKNNLHLIMVTDEDNQQFKLLRFDISNEFIIGYDTGSQRMRFIPKDKVKKVETFSSMHLQDKLKYSPSISGRSGDAVVVKTLEVYYGYLTQKIRNDDDTKKFLRTVSMNYKYKYLNGITTVSSEIVTRKMNNEPYRSLDVVDYYGIVCSVPEYLAPNKNDGPGVEYRQVYVKEYWKGQIFDMQFTLRSLDGHIWEIEEIEDTSFVFNQ